ncbi:MAG: polymer-forming cytoskeletal protein [Thermaerobacter sp.]|nr:polymer-forming cytoskeletal protein [Thermaerobacter sp.]
MRSALLAAPLALGILLTAGTAWAAKPPLAPLVVPAGSTRVHGILAVGRGVVVEGTVRGDVFLVGGRLTLGSGARVQGSVGVLGGRLSVAPGAYVRGGTFQMDLSRLDLGDLGDMASAIFLYDLLRAFLALGAVLLAAGVGLFFPGFVQTVGAGVAHRPGRAALAGVLTVFLALLLFLLLAVSLVGIPLALAVLGLTALAAFLGMTGLAHLIGERSQRVLLAAPTSPAGKTALGMGVLQVASFLPVVGGMVFLAAAFLSLGGLLMAGRGLPARSRPTA